MRKAAVAAESAFPEPLSIGNIRHEIKWIVPGQALDENQGGVGRENQEKIAQEQPQVLNVFDQSSKGQVAKEGIGRPANPVGLTISGTQQEDHRGVTVN